jgi:hypothetical protein
MPAPRFVTGREWSDCTIADASSSGARVIFPGIPPAGRDDNVIVEVPQVGMINARVMRSTGNSLGLAFEEVDDDIRDDLIRFLYTVPRQVTVTEPPRATDLLPVIAKRFFGPDLVPNVPHDRPK